MKRKLVIIPFGGGSSYSYESMRVKFPNEMELILLELPGHGQRIDETLLTDVRSLCSDIVASLKNINGSFALFGHCLGGLLAFNVARILSETGLSPEGIFISGCPGPSAFTTSREQELSKDDVRNFLLSFNTDRLLVENDSFIEMMEPIVKADVRAFQSYIHVPGRPLECPITIIKRDDYQIKYDDLHRWQYETTLPIEYKILEKEFYDTQLPLILSEPFGDRNI